MASRGVELVEKVIHHLRKQGGKVKLDWCDKPAKPVPIAEAALAKLTLPGGKPLPPSLRRWLAFDAKAIGLFENVGKARWHAPMKITELCEDQFQESFDGFAQILPGDCYLIPGGTDQRRFFYVGEPDPAGEYPVFTIDPDALPYVVMSAPDLGVYLAELTEVIEEPDSMEAFFDHPDYREAMRAQARLNFHGWQGAELESHVLGIDGKMRGWPRKQAGRKSIAAAGTAKGTSKKGKKPAKVELGEALKKKIDTYAKRTRKKGNDLGMRALEMAKKELGKIDEATANAVAAYTGADPDFMFGVYWVLKSER